MSDKRGRGRPSKITKLHVAKIVAAYSTGATDSEVAGMLGISERHLYRLKKSDELCQAITIARGKPDKLVEAAVFHRATGYYFQEEKIHFDKYGNVSRAKVLTHVPPDAKCAMFWLTNRAPDRWKIPQYRNTEETPIKEVGPIVKKSFSEFCGTAGYPLPFEKQNEMRAFGLEDQVPRLLLGARGYGKTDYVVILGIGYEIYCEWIDRKLESSTLIMSKSKERNAAMINEIEQACLKNGVVFEQANSTSLRVAGHHGKDHTVSAVTIKSVSLRGRHPKRIIMDDPVTEDDTSEATRKVVEKKYYELHKLTSNILIIGQPAHKFDLYAKLRPLLKKMEVPWGTIPELDHDLEAQKLAGVSEASIEASYHLRILAEGATPFDNIKYSDLYPVGPSVAFIDPASEGTDDTAITILRMVGDGVFAVGFKWRKAWNHCLDDIAVLLRKYQVQRLCFETNSLGDQPLTILRQVFGSTGVVGKKSVTNKHARIMAAGSYAHLIHLCRDSGPGYIDAVVQYEYGVKHDDAPDSLATCMEWVGLIKGKGV
jgi:hypothetical protein